MGHPSGIFVLNCWTVHPHHPGTRLPPSTIIHFWLGGGEGLFDMRDATENGYRAIWSIARGVGLGSWYTVSLPVLSSV